MIINSYDEYLLLLQRLDVAEHIVTPIYRDEYYHPVANELLCVGITFLSGETYILSITHKDATQFRCPHGNARSFTPDIKRYSADVDITAMAFVHHIKMPTLESFYTPFITDSHHLFAETKDVNRVTPLTVWGSVLKKYNAELLRIVKLSEPAYAFQDAVRVLGEIERAGLAVDTSLVTKYFGEKATRYVRDGYVYTQYNPYTSTGRPSNRFGGINFSALNKSDGSRETFISRYGEKGVLVQFDFEAYHLRLAADELGVYLPPNESIHTQLARKYYNTGEISTELYAEGKQRTFEIMYGISTETYGVELFERVQGARQVLWEQYTKTNRVKLPSGISVTVDNPTPSKVYNYYIQNLEFHRTIPKLLNVLNVLNYFDGRLVLYTYDSILLDLAAYDELLLKKIKRILEEDGKFPVRGYRGTTYNNLEEIVI